LSPTDSRPIVHVIGALIAGGAERFVAQLLPALGARGHRTALVCLTRQRDAASEEMAAGLRAARVPLLEGPTPRLRARAITHYARTLRALDPGIVHLHNLNADAAHFLALPLLGRLRPLGVRTIHNTELRVTPLVRLALRFNPIDATVFCSESAQARNHALVGDGPQKAIPNGVSFATPLRDASTIRAARIALALDPERCHFVCIGRLGGVSPEQAPKAHDVLIRAWRQAELGRKGARLHLLGDGPLRAALEARAEGDASIVFHGVVGNVATWLQAVDCFVMPSRFEGMPIAAIEAMGAGLHCLFSRIPALTELGAPSASWCDPGDVPTLAAALEAFRLAPRFADPKDVEACRERYSIDRAARDHLEFYEASRG